MLWQVIKCLGSERGPTNRSALLRDFLERLPFALLSKDSVLALRDAGSSSIKVTVMYFSLFPPFFLKHIESVAIAE